MKLFKIKNTYINLDTTDAIIVRKVMPIEIEVEGAEKDTWKVYIKYSGEGIDDNGYLILTNKEADGLISRLDFVAGLSFADQQHYG